MMINPHPEVGALAFGGNVSGIAFDLTSVPESSSMVLALAIITVRRKRN